MPSLKVCVVTVVPADCLLSLPLHFPPITPFLPSLCFFICLLSPSIQGTRLSWGEETLAEKGGQQCQNRSGYLRAPGQKGAPNLWPSCHWGVRLGLSVNNRGHIFTLCETPNLRSNLSNRFPFLSCSATRQHTVGGIACRESFKPKNDPHLNIQTAVLPLDKWLNSCQLRESFTEACLLWHY